ncbi:MAG TPA: hypothetical protein VFX35_07725, partial [Solirubrobacterales bacterium]|nr:hypothetical protein [Solirubrobacterales bacterium]
MADVYGSERLPGGWETNRILTPAGTEGRVFVPGGVSSDHLYSLSRTEAQYLDGLDGSRELVGLGKVGVEPYAEARYLGADGTHIIFSTGHGFDQSFVCFPLAGECEVNRLEPDAPPTGTGAVYDREADGETHVVSLLPGDEPLKAGEEAYWKGTSKDGTATAFEVEEKLYVRLDNQLTKEVAPGKSIFAGVSDDGGYVFYVVPAGSEEAGTIHRFNTATGADAVANPGDEGLIVNVSGDGSHVYFISEAQLDGKGTAGEPNLYVWSGGSPTYVATVLPSDLVRTSDAGNLVPALANWTSHVTNKPTDGVEQGPGGSSSRTTPDGSVIVFESRARLTAYDNAGHTEIYRYEDGNASPECVSCNLGDEPARGDAQLQDLILTPTSNIVHNVSDNGSLVFFETDEALSNQDVDGINDIYEWREGHGNPSLISSGQSQSYPFVAPFNELLTPNIILSVTPDGEDVVFISQDALVPGAPGGGAGAIYDARVNGGFPIPPARELCVEETCKPGPEAPAPFSSGSASESAHSSGNMKPKKHRRTCRSRSQKRCSKHKKAKRRRAPASASGAGKPDADAQIADQPAVTVSRDGSSDSPDPGREDLGGSPASSARPAVADPPVEYGIEKVSAGLSSTAAGMHPDFSPNILLKHVFKENGQLSENMDRTEEVSVSAPPGLIGNINAVPRCPTAQLVAASCPTDSQVGVTTAYVTWIGPKFTEPVYNLEPPHPDKEIARLGFTGALFPVFIDIKVRTASDYGVTATVYGPSGFVSLVGAETTLWGNPANEVHDKQRLTPTEASNCKTACEAEKKGPNGEIIKGERASTIPVDQRKAFMTNPSACQSGQVDFAVRSYQLPGQVFTASAPLPAITDCTGLPFAPSFTAEPTSKVAGAPTGLHTTLTLPQHL